MGLFYVCFKFDFPSFGLCAAGDIRIAGNRDSGQFKEGKQVMANMPQERAFQSQVAGLAAPSLRSGSHIALCASPRMFLLAV